MKNEHDFKQGDRKYLPQAGDIIRDISQHRPIPIKRRFNFKLSSEDEDKFDVTDYKLSPIHHIGFRWRKKYAYNFNDKITFLFDHNNGASWSAEWDKIINGKGEYFLYAWVSENLQKIENYVFFDLDCIREHLIGYDNKMQNKNRGSIFKCYPISFLEKHSAIIDATFEFRNADGVTNSLQKELF